MMGTSGGEGSLNISRTTQERFVYHLGVLDSLVDADKDEEWTWTQDEKGEWVKAGPRTLADLLDANSPNELGRFDKFSDYFRYWTRIDSLMRRQGFYTTRKNVSRL